MDDGDVPGSREEKLLPVRIEIALRWKSLLQGGCESPGKVDRQKCEQFEKQLQQLATLHGAEVPFAPWPVIPPPRVLEDEPQQGQVLELDDKSTRDCPDHSFKYLVNQQSVWTALQARIAAVACANCCCNLCFSRARSMLSRPWMDMPCSWQSRNGIISRRHLLSGSPRTTRACTCRWGTCSDSALDM